MTRQLVHEAWDDYRRKVIPQDAPAVQLTECQRAFYAGISWMFHQARVIGEDRTSVGTGVEMLDGIHSEIRHFAKKGGM